MKRLIKSCLFLIVILGLSACKSCKDEKELPPCNCAADEKCIDNICKPCNGREDMVKINDMCIIKSNALPGVSKGNCSYKTTEGCLTFDSTYIFFNCLAFQNLTDMNVGAPIGSTLLNIVKWNKIKYHIFPIQENMAILYRRADLKVGLKFTLMGLTGKTGFDRPTYLPIDTLAPESRTEWDGYFNEDLTVLTMKVVLTNPNYATNRFDRVDSCVMEYTYW